MYSYHTCCTIFIGFNVAWMPKMDFFPSHFPPTYILLIFHLSKKKKDYPLYIFNLIPYNLFESNYKQIIFIFH